MALVMCHQLARKRLLDCKPPGIHPVLYDSCIKPKEMLTAMKCKSPEGCCFGIRCLRKAKFPPCPSTRAEWVNHCKPSACITNITADSSEEVFVWKPALSFNCPLVPLFKSPNFPWHSVLQLLNISIQWNRAPKHVLFCYVTALNRCTVPLKPPGTIHRRLLQSVTSTEVVKLMN